MNALGITMVVAVMVFSLAACGDGDGGGKGDNIITAPTTSGSLTITCLDTYEGKYVYAVAIDDIGNLVLIAAERGTANLTKDIQTITEMMQVLI